MILRESDFVETNAPGGAAAAVAARTRPVVRQASRVVSRGSGSHPQRRARVALVGLSGYAAELCQLLRAEQRQPTASTDFAGLFVHDPQNHRERLADLRAEGLRLYDRFEQMLDDPEIDAVWLPVPINLHRTMAQQVLAADKALMLEKPVAGCVADHLAISAAQRVAKRPVLVGFQDIYPSNTARLKQALLSGRLGTPQRAVVSASWPRPHAYYQRNSWAGAMRRDGVAVYDSPLSNALAHFSNLALFLLGRDLNAAAEMHAVTSQLFRVRPIENFDTCSLRAELRREEQPIDLVVLLTHAGRQGIDPVVEIDTDRGTLKWHFSGQATFREHGAAAVKELAAPMPPRPSMVRRLGAAVVGGEIEPPGEPATYADLTNTLPHTQLVEAVQRSVAVTDVPSALLDVDAGSDPSASIRHIEEWFAKAAARRQTLAELGTPLTGAVGRFEAIESLGHAK